MGSGLRFRVHPSQGHETQNKKENHIMKNRNIQFKPTAGVLIPLLLACLAAVSISAPKIARAHVQAPFTWPFRSRADSRKPEDHCTMHASTAFSGNAIQYT